MVAIVTLMSGLITKRIDDLREDVTGLRGDIKDLRGETATEFKAVRAEMQAGFQTIRDALAEALRART